MSERIKNFAQTYKLALLIGVFFSINALTTSIIAGLSGVDHWENLTYTQCICIIAAIVGSWTNVMLAFFNKTLSRIESGKPPIPAGDTNPPFKPEPKV